MPTVKVKYVIWRSKPGQASYRQTGQARDLTCTEADLPDLLTRILDASAQAWRIPRDQLSLKFRTHGGDWSDFT